MSPLLVPKLRPARRRSKPNLTVEPLEERCLPSVTPSPPDDFGNTLATAELLDLPVTLTTSQLGGLDYASDVDVFRLRPTATADLNVQLFRGRFSNLDSFLIVRDGLGNQIASNDNRWGDTVDAQVAFHVVANQTYYLEVSASPFAPSSSSSPQTYVLFIEPYLDDFGNTLTNATALPLGNQPVVQAGVIQVGGDADVFSFVAPSTGGLSVRMSASDGSQLDCQLSILDTSGNLLLQNDDSLDTLNSLLTLRIVAGQTYFVRASASPLALSSTGTGGYNLTLTPFADESGSTTLDPLNVALSAGGTSSTTATIGSAGDTDVFRLVAPVNGPIVIEQRGVGTLDSSLLVLDAAANEIARNDNIDSSTRDSRVLLDAVAGQTYFIRAGAVSAGTGQYTLRLTSYTDDAGNTAATGLFGFYDGFSQASYDARIEAPGDVDYFSFLSLITGDLSVELVSLAGTGFAGQLTVFNGVGQQLTQRIDSDGSGVTRAIFTVNYSQSYDIRVGAGTQASGAYRLRFGPLVDDFADKFGQAHELVMPTSGLLVQDGVGGASDTDAFTFVAPFTGSLAVRVDAVAGSSVDPIVQVYDANLNLLAENDDTGQSRNSRVALEVVQGQRYYVNVVTPFGAAGEYALSLGRYTDDASGNLASATLLNVTATGTTTRSGRIEVTGDQDLYRFVAPFTGTLIVRQNADHSGLDSLLTVLDANGVVMAQDDESGGQHNARLLINIVAGETYHVRAAAFGPSYSLPASGETGTYTLLFSAAGDDFGDTVGTAQALVTDASGLVIVHGEIGAAGDVDVFRFLPTSGGGFTIRQQADGSFLDSLLVLYDASGNELDRNDDDGGSLNSRLGVTLTAGQTYYIQAGAYSESQGAYTLSLTPVVDDHASTLDAAETITLSNDRAVLIGEIETASDVDIFKLVATQTGGLVLRQQASNGALDSLLTVYDSDGNVVAQNDDSQGTLNSLLLINVVAGKTYYIQAGAYSTSTGAYTLSVDAYEDDAPNTQQPDNPSIPLLDVEPTQQTGTIEVSGDVDYHQFVAPTTGTLTLRMDNTPGGTFIDSFLQVFDDAGLGLVQNDDSGGTLGSQVSFDVVAGQTYFVRASASPFATTALAAGGYRLLFAPITPPPDDYADDLAGAATLTLSPQNAVTQLGTIEQADDTDYFRFTAPTDRMYVIRLARQTGNLDCILTLCDAAGNLLALNDDSDGRTDSRIQLWLNAGETYYLRASSFGTSTGGYRLMIHPANPYLDDFGNVGATAPVFFVGPSGPFSLHANLERPWDRDVFAIVTETAGQVVVRVTPDSSGLTPLVSIFDFQEHGGPFTNAAGNPLPEAAFPGGDFFLYFVEVAAADIGQGGSAAGYQLEVFYSTDDFPDDTQLVFSGNAASQTGNIERIGDTDNFAFIAPFTGTLTVSLSAGTGSNLVPSLTVRDEFRDLVRTGASTMTLNVVEGRTYHVEAAGLGFSHGSYVLDVMPTPDEENGQPAIDLGTPIERVLRHGIIGTLGDVDTYTFTAALTGAVRVRVETTAGSDLDGYLTVLNGLGATMATNDDFNGSLRESQAIVSVVAGQTYTVRVSASPFLPGGIFDDYRIGSYTLGVTPVTALTVTAVGADVSGSIDTAGGADLYRLVAPVTCSLTLQMTTPASSLDAFLVLYDSQGRRMAQNNDSGISTDSFLRVNVTAGQVLFVEASGSPVAQALSQTGAYDLQFSFGATDLELTIGSQLITLDPGGNGTATGSLLVEGEQDVYRFEATRTGLLTVRNTASGSNLDATLYVYDAANQLLASASGATGQATFEAVARQIYFIRVAATPFAQPGATLGSFTVTIGPDDVGGFNNATLLNGSGSGSLDGTGDLDVFQVVATLTGTITVTLSSAGGARLDASVALYDADTNELVSSGGGLTFSVLAGQTYYVQVTGNDGSTAKYNLDVGFEVQTNVAEPDVTFTDTFSTPGTTSTSTNTTVSVGELALFADPELLEAGASELESATQQVADLSQVGESSAALVAVLIVGAGEDDLLLTQGGEGDGALADIPGLDDGTWFAEDERVGSIDSRFADALFALQSELETAIFRAKLLSALIPGKQPEVLMYLFGELARKVGNLTPPEPGIEDLLIPEPLPKEELPAPIAPAELEHNEEEVSQVDPMTAALAMTAVGFARGVRGKGREARRKRKRAE